MRFQGCPCHRYLQQIEGFYCYWDSFPPPWHHAWECLHQLLPFQMNIPTLLIGFVDFLLQWWQSFLVLVRGVIDLWLIFTTFGSFGAWLSVLQTDDYNDRNPVLGYYLLCKLLRQVGYSAWVNCGCKSVKQLNLQNLASGGFNGLLRQPAHGVQILY